MLGLKEEIFTEANHYVADIKKEALVVDDKVKAGRDLEELDSYIETVKDEVKLEIRQAYIWLVLLSALLLNYLIKLGYGFLILCIIKQSR